MECSEYFEVGNVLDMVKLKNRLHYIASMCSLMQKYECQKMGLKASEIPTNTDHTWNIYPVHNIKYKQQMIKIQKKEIRTKKMFSTAILLD